MRNTGKNIVQYLKFYVINLLAELRVSGEADVMSAQSYFLDTLKQKQSYILNSFK